MSESTTGPGSIAGGGAGTNGGAMVGASFEGRYQLATKESLVLLLLSDSVSKTITVLMLGAIVFTEENAYATASSKKHETLVQKA